MAKLQFLLSILLLSITYIASISAQLDKNSCSCLSDRDVDVVLKDFTTVIRTTAGYKEVAERRLVKDLVAVSDSYAYINAKPLNGTICRTRTLFITLVELDWTQHGPIDTIFISHTCDTITWYNTVTAVPENGVKTPIRGIYVFKVNKDKKITTIYREQNSAAQLYAIYPDVGNRPDCKSEWRPINGLEGTRKTDAKCGSCG